MKFAVPLATCCLLAATGAADSHNAGSAMFKSLHAAHDVPLDTNPQSEFWHEAKPVYISVDSRGDPHPRYRTAVRSRWPDESLYVFFECLYKKQKQKPKHKTQKKTKKQKKKKKTEIFIGSDFQNIRRYK